MKFFETKNFSMQRLTKGELPSLPFVDIKNKILGRGYCLGLIFVSSKTMDELSLQYKKELGHRDVLGFEYSNKEGEIFINLKTIQSSATTWGHTYTQHILFIFVHECLHLKGLSHGREMDNLEKKYMKKFWENTSV